MYKVLEEKAIREDYYQPKNSKKKKRREAEECMFCNEKCFFLNEAYTST